MKWRKRDGLETVFDVFMRNIGIDSLEVVNEWYKKSNALSYHIDLLSEAAELIKRFKDKTVTIVGDYDADGITSTSILVIALTRLGFSDVRYRIPKRFSEGFGISEKIVDEINSGLVVTVDNGIAQPEIIKKAKEKGLTVIVTDHHEPLVVDGKVILPEADIVIDPNAIEGSADFNGYCGAGIAYKLAVELLGKSDPQLLSLAGVGTVADVMPLKEENYVFVRKALTYLINCATTTTGMYALISSLTLTKHISAKDIGFKIGPCANAASRMNDDGAKEVVELLTFNGPFEKAIPMAERLIEINEERKTAKKEGLEAAERIISDECLYGEVPLVVNVPDVKHGIIGILAGALCEKYKVPAIVVSDIEGALKGSARSVEGYNIKNALDKCSDTLVAYGGHEGAAGLTVGNLENFKAKIQSLPESVDFVPESVEEAFYDLVINAKDIPSTIEELEKCGPFGEGNPEIVFKIEGFSTIPKYGVYVKTMGDGSIVKIFSKNCSAIGFGLADRLKDTKTPKRYTLYGTLSTNYFGGSVEHQIEFVDFEEEVVEKIETPLAARLKALAVS